MQQFTTSTPSALPPGGHIRQSKAVASRSDGQGNPVDRNTSAASPRWGRRRYGRRGGGLPRASLLCRIVMLAVVAGGRISPPRECGASSSDLVEIDTYSYSSTSSVQALGDYQFANLSIDRRPLGYSSALQRQASSPVSFGGLVTEGLDSCSPGLKVSVPRASVFPVFLMP